MTLRFSEPPGHLSPCNRIVLEPLRVRLHPRERCCVCSKLLELVNVLRDYHDYRFARLPFRQATHR